jgi:hypothetical protein
LRIIHHATGDKRIPAVWDNVTHHLFDAMIIGPDGRDHLAWNIQLKEGPGKKLEAVGHTIRPISLPGYPNLLEPMRKYADRTQDPVFLDKIARLETTLASYVFSDGTLPSSLDAQTPLMQVVPSALLPEFWLYLARRLGHNLQQPVIAPRAFVTRSYQEITWKEDEWAWTLESGGKPLYAGIKLNPGAVFIGEEKPANLPPKAFAGEPVLEQVVLGRTGADGGIG